MHQGQLCSAGLIGSAATAPKSAVVAASLDVDAQPSTGSVRPSLSGDHQVQRGKGKRKSVRVIGCDAYRWMDELRCGWRSAAQCWAAPAAAVALRFRHVIVG